jgi:hypothetical protein
LSLVFLFTPTPLDVADDGLATEAGILDDYMTQDELAEEFGVHPRTIARWIRLSEQHRDWAEDNGLTLVPVLRHMANVQVIGVARLR